MENAQESNVPKSIADTSAGWGLGTLRFVNIVLRLVAAACCCLLLLAAACCYLLLLAATCCYLLLLAAAAAAAAAAAKCSLLLLLLPVLLTNATFNYFLNQKQLLQTFSAVRSGVV